MGGYGALHLAMSRPGTFSVVWAMSPCCLAPLADAGIGNSAWARAYVIEQPAEIEQAIERRDFYVVAAFGLLSAFRPDTTRPPFYIDFPFDMARGEVVPDEPEIIEYEAQFPLERVDERRAALRRLRALVLDYGIDDQFAHIPVATRALSQRLAELRIPHRLDVYDGDHREHISQRLETLVLPFLATHLDGPR